MEQDDLIFSEPEFEGRPNADRRLSKVGILENHPGVQALVFLVESFPNHAISVGGLLRHDTSSDIEELVIAITDCFNDDHGTQNYRMLGKR